jgi:branched-chain amino acid transport system ATP-binding protein
MLRQRPAAFLAKTGQNVQLVRLPPTMTALTNVMAGVLYGAAPTPYREAAYEAAGVLGELNLMLKAGQRLDQLTYIEQISSRSASSWRVPSPPIRASCCSMNGCPASARASSTAACRWSGAWRRKASQGIAVILVEHVMTAVRALCGRVVVMNAGGKIAEGAPAACCAIPR